MTSQTPADELPVPGDVTSLHVHRAISGDVTSTSWLVERLNPLLLAQASWRLGSELRRSCDPEDLVHEAWLVLLPRLPSLPARDGRMTPVLLSFLSTTILHKVHNLLRHAARRRVAPDHRSSDDTTPPEPEGPRSEVIRAVVRRETACRVRAALDELDARDREIVLLRGIEQQPPEDVAGLVGSTNGAVCKRYQRALAKLRARLPDSVFAELIEQ
ncbi:MAG TPA: sigma-70 family RNA polymerase sigma factor [Planctomycetota bacterium]|nr:sigma-70 family RNA polymerase sigma factor [Planctomycetota bacterium]